MSNRPDEDDTHDADSVQPRLGALGRRDIMKMGAGVVATALGTGKAAAQGRGRGAPAPPPGQPRPAGIRPHTGPGYKYTANREGNNGPMDDTTRKVVKFVREFDESRLTVPVMKALNRTMVDSMAACISSFETAPARISARMARYAQPVELKATVFGYGVTTTPELAAFANGVLVRETDLNDATAHYSNVVPPVLAVAEALHSTGTQVLTAVALGYELYEIGAGESVAPAMACGKLMGLDEDHLANALTIALTPHVALNKGVGTLSMWKGVRTAEATKCGVWAALLAREGMTGPPQPFEGRGGLWAIRGKREFNLPTQPDLLCIQRQWFKRHPAGASMQAPILLIQTDIRKWTKPEEVAWMTVDMDEIGENSDNPKWDPPNRETADHSMPYVIARTMIDGDFWLDSFTDAKLKDPVARELMSKMTFGQVESWRGAGVMRITIHKKNGEERFFDTFGGIRQPGLKDYPYLSDEEVSDKFNRVCAYMKVDNAQRDRARDMFWNLRQVKDIGEAIQTMAKFGQPKPL